MSVPNLDQLGGEILAATGAGRQRAGVTIRFELVHAEHLVILREAFEAEIANEIYWSSFDRGGNRYYCKLENGDLVVYFENISYEHLDEFAQTIGKWPEIYCSVKRVISASAERVSTA